MKSLLNCLFFTFLLSFISCDNQKVEQDKIDAKFVISRYEALSKYAMQNISEQIPAIGTDYALISFLKTDNVPNIHIQSPRLTVGALAVAQNIFSADFVLLNSDTLSMTSPLLFPGYFFNEFQYIQSKDGYGQPIEWLVNTANHRFEISSNFQAELYRVQLNTNDTFKFDKPLEVSWSYVPSNSKVYVSFQWYPSYSDVNYRKFYPGYEVEDTGNFSIPVDFNSNFQIPNFGVLQVNVTRYNIKTQLVFGKNIFVANAVESSASVIIGKR